jgi:hypothetical protein
LVNQRTEVRLRERSSCFRFRAAVRDRGDVGARVQRDEPCSKKLQLLPAHRGDIVGVDRDVYLLGLRRRRAVAKFEHSQGCFRPRRAPPHARVRTGGRRQRSSEGDQDERQARRRRLDAIAIDYFESRPQAWQELRGRAGVVAFCGQCLRPTAFYLNRINRSVLGRESGTPATLEPADVGIAAPGSRAYGRSGSGNRFNTARTTRPLRERQQEQPKTHLHGKAQVMSSYTESEPLPDERESEHERVNRWRFEQFSSLGFEPSEALLLAASAADLREARALVAAGCTLRLALEILL